MTRQELLQVAKPILFNTDMARAILEGRKTVTRRVIKQKVVADVLSSPARLAHPNLTDKDFVNCLCDAPYDTDDVLWVRETWRGDDIIVYEYKADGMPHKQPHNLLHWRPSIHMPKEAARLFLRVTGVWVEQLQDITAEQVDAEGCKEWVYSAITGEFLPSKPTWFEIAWDNTVKKKELDRYGWNANPWVWVIEFERVEVTA